MSEEFEPKNQETHPDYNRQAGLVPIPGSAAAREYARWEQFPSKWTVGGLPPGNPYVFREYPMMVYRAERSALTGGKIACMAAQPNPLEFRDPRELARAEDAAIRFTARCQKIVKDEDEYRRAVSDGWAEDPDQAIKRQEDREKGTFKETAHRAYDDRNMSEPAKREIAAAVQEAGGAHIPEIVEQPLAKRRGRPRKNPDAA